MKTIKRQQTEENREKIILCRKTALTASTFSRI